MKRKWMTLILLLTVCVMVAYTAQEARGEQSQSEQDAIVFEEAIVLPEHSREFMQWMTAPISSEETEAAEQGTLLLVIPEEEEPDHYLIVGCERLKYNEEGELGAFFPGLILCTAKEEENIIPVFYAEVSEAGYQMDTLCSSMIVAGDLSENQWARINAVSMVIDNMENAGMITNVEMKIEEDAVIVQEEIELMEWLVYHGTFGKNDQGDYVSYRDMQSGSMGLGWGIEMNGEPLALELRPITAEDDIHFMYSIINKDGTGYSRISE